MLAIEPSATEPRMRRVFGVGSPKKRMRSAHGAWINDSYWFLMPYKLRDPGVTLKYDGEVKDSTTAAVYDRLALSFENVGMTPGDRYWVYVNRANHRVEK